MLSELRQARQQADADARDTYWRAVTNVADGNDKPTDNEVRRLDTAMQRIGFDDKTFAKDVEALQESRRAREQFLELADRENDQRVRHRKALAEFEDAKTKFEAAKAALEATNGPFLQIMHQASGRHAAAVRHLRDRGFDGELPVLPSDADVLQPEPLPQSDPNQLPPIPHAWGPRPLSSGQLAFMTKSVANPTPVPSPTTGFFAPPAPAEHDQDPQPEEGADATDYCDPMNQEENDDQHRPDR